MRTLALVLASVFLFRWSAGCDDRPSVPAASVPAPPASAPAAKENARPTTQQLADGKWKTLPLSTVPMNITVPESWRLGSVAENRLMSLEGFSPSGYVEIHVAARGSVDADKFAGFIVAAEKSIADKGERKRRFNVKRQDDFVLIERQYSEEARPMPVMDDKGNFVDRVGEPLRWSFLIFIKNVDKFDGYELTFDELPFDQFKQDEQFLQKIADSLTYDASRKTP